MKRPPTCVPAAVFLLAVVFLTPARADGGPVIPWLNAIRAAAGSPPLAADDLLSRTAADWARALAAAGVISHRGPGGTNALDRYRAYGGTEVRVGEIIGAGPGLPAVEKGWETSESHRRLALERRWTHAGFGECTAGSGQEVWVVLFCEKLVDDLSIASDDARLIVSGRFAVRQAVGAVMLAGIDAHSPREWDPKSRAFVFRLAADGLPAYIRLGFVTADGSFRLTNAFTLPRETESPGGTSRFAAPEASP